VLPEREGMQQAASGQSMKDIAAKTLQAVLVAALLWLGSSVKDLVVAIDNHGDSIDQLYDWVSDHEEAHK